MQAVDSCSVPLEMPGLYANAHAPCSHAGSRRVLSQPYAPCGLLLQLLHAQISWDVSRLVGQSMFRLRAPTWLKTKLPRNS
jgi:hypothetical protein